MNIGTCNSNLLVICVSLTVMSVAKHISSCIKQHILNDRPDAYWQAEAEQETERYKLELEHRERMRCSYSPHSYVQ